MSSFLVALANLVKHLNAVISTVLRATKTIKKGTEWSLFNSTI